MTKSNDMSLYGRLLSYAKPKIWAFAIAFFGFLLYGSTSALQAELVRQIIIALEEMGDNPPVIEWTHPIVWIPLSIVILFVIRGVGTFLSTYYLDLVSRYVIHKLRVDLFRSIQRLPLGYFSSNNAGNMVNRINFNVEQVAAASSGVINSALREGLTVLITLGYMAYLEWRLTLVMLTVTPIIIAVVTFTSRFFRRYSRRIQDSMGEVTQASSENIKGQSTIRVFGGNDREISQFEKISFYNMKQTLKLTITRAVSTPIIQFFLSLELAAIIWLAFWFKVSPENLIAFFSAAVAISKPMRSITQINQNLQKGLAAAEDIFEQLDVNEETDQGSIKLENAKGSVRFDNVSFRYPNQSEEALTDISFSVEPGQSIALVGRSGGGKSTLVSLIPRFHNVTRGQILLDDKPISEISLSNLREQIALVSQQPVLFHGSVYDNIAYARPEATREEVLKAAEQAHVLEFADMLPDKLDTDIGVDGSLLSGGQKQRVAIARAILKDAPIMILDEATSALDNESERFIQDALDHFMENRTTFVIAHRLSTVEKADTIVVVDNGKIIEQGSHKELIANNGLYKQLHQMQFRDEG